MAALPCRSIAHAQAIEQRLLSLVQQGKPLHIMIVGGGISAIEALGEILRRYRDVPSLSVEVVEAGERRLPGLPPVLDADVRRLCQPHAVRFRTGTVIASVSPKAVHLADGVRLHSELTLWTAGLAAPALLQQSGLARPPQVWADVHPTLQSRHARSTFVFGDSAQLPHAVAKQAYNAIDMGELAAINVTSFLAGAPLKPYQPNSKPVLIAFGDLDTYLVAGKTMLASQALAAAKEGVFQLFMSQMAPCSVLQSLPAATGLAGLSWAGTGAIPVLLGVGERPFETGCGSSDFAGQCRRTPLPDFRWPWGRATGVPQVQPDGEARTEIASRVIWPCWPATASVGGDRSLPTLSCR